MIAGLLILAGSILGSCALSPQDIFSRTKECSISSTDFSKCLHGAIQNVISNLINEDVDEDEKMDPLLIPEISSTYGSLPMERMGITLSNLTLHGLSSTIVHEVRTKVKDLSALRMEMDVRTPVLHLDGLYSAQLMAAEDAVSSQGSFNVSILEATGTLLIKGHVVMRDNAEYLQVDKASFKPKIKNMKLDLSTEDDPYPELTTMVISLVNSYWRIVFSEALPAIEDSMDRVIREYAEELTEGIPFYEIVSP